MSKPYRVYRMPYQRAHVVKVSAKGEMVGWIAECDSIYQARRICRLLNAEARKGKAK